MRDSDAYLTQLQALLPPGRAWSRDPDAALTAVIGISADGLARADARAGSLIRESDPRDAIELLEQWEGMFGLPDSCAPPEAYDTLAERRAALAQRVTAIGGVTPQYLIDLAAAMGFAITITEIRPTVCGVAQCGDELIPAEAIFGFEINAPATSVIDAECGNTECGEPLGSAVENTALECLVRRVAPAHTTPYFNYAV
jgi:uncharacterized protein YmfQ (DUF2313 family)